MRQSVVRQKNGGWYYRLGLSKKRTLWGMIFLSPWLLGFLLFFLKPLVESVMYSFNKIKVVEGGVSASFVGLENYVKALTVDLYFNRLILTMIASTLPNVLVVIIFSLLAAVLLNGKFRGRSIARTVFFIPIIMGTSIASTKMAGNDIISKEIAGSSGMSTFGTHIIFDVLANTGLPTEIVGYVSGAVSGIFSILAVSGVPIIIFLAGLQSISPLLYEVAEIEGSSAYETFWKVTLPMVSPMVLLCTIYSIIDSFFRHRIIIDETEYGIIQRMYDVAFRDANYGLSSAMTVIYLLVSLIVIGIISFIISRVVFYYD